MKLIQIFGKSPRYKKFNYEPRFYDPQEEERRERELRIRQELIQQEKRDAAASADAPPLSDHRTRMVGSFRQASRLAPSQKPDLSANMLRLIILLMVTVGLIAFIEFGTVALYGFFFAIVPLYLYLRFKPMLRKKE